MNPHFWFDQRTYSNVQQRSACLVKKGLMRAMIRLSFVATAFDGTLHNELPPWKCFENAGREAYRLVQHSRHSDVTMAWLIHDFSHRASSN